MYLQCAPPPAVAAVLLLLLALRVLRPPVPHSCSVPRRLFARLRDLFCRRGVVRSPRNLVSCSVVTSGNLQVTQNNTSFKRSKSPQLVGDEMVVLCTTFAPRRGKKRAMKRDDLLFEACSLLSLLVLPARSLTFGVKKCLPLAGGSRSPAASVLRTTMPRMNVCFPEQKPDRENAQVAAA